MEQDESGCSNEIMIRFHCHYLRLCRNLRFLLDFLKSYIHIALNLSVTSILVFDLVTVLSKYFIRVPDCVVNVNIVAEAIFNH